MLATHEAGQVAGEVFGGIGDIFERADACHRSEGAHEVEGLFGDAVGEEAGTVDGGRRETVATEPASMESTCP